MSKKSALIWYLKRFKRFILLSCLLLMVAMTTLISAADQPVSAIVSPFPFVVLGEELQGNIGVLVNNHIYLPLRQIGDLFGIQIDFTSEMVLVEGQAQPNARGESFASLAFERYEVRTSPFPLVVRGYQVTPNPGILIQNQTYLPLRRLSEILGVAIDFKNETVYLGGTTRSFEEQPVPLAAATASAAFIAPLVAETVWVEGGEYHIASLEEFQALLELMVSHLGQSAFLRVTDANVAVACHGFIQNYTLERVQGITLDIGHSGGSMTLTYSSMQEVLAAQHYSGLQLSGQAQQLSEVVEQVLRTEIKAGMSAYDKEKAIHDFLTRHVEYDLDAVGRTEATPSSTAYGALVLRKAVCSGYAEAFKLFMDLLDIECRIVVGRAGNVDHAWNIVYLDGAYYHVDVTWDDPVTYDENGKRIPNIEPRYGFFNLSDKLLAYDHNWDHTAYPVANGTTYRPLRFDDSQEMLMQGIEEMLRQGSNAYSSRCLFYSNVSLNQTDLARRILEGVGVKYGFSSITLSSDSHGTVIIEFS